MARRGRFGRRPPVGNSLTATIIAIDREMQAARDRNIMSAWQNGGTFEGKPVTDSDLIGHFRKRMRGLDQDDPLYDSYKLEVDQLDYRINESRQSTLYAQGKISDRQMGQFYLNWARKIPRDSEFYRQLQRDGARFMKVVQARGRASSKAASDASFSEGQANTAKSAAAGELITRVLTNMAVVNGLLDPTDTAGLAHLSDPGQFMTLIERMNTNPDEPIYVEGGQVVTGADVFAALKAADPTFQPPTLVAIPDQAAPVRGGGLTNDYIIRAWQTTHATNLTLAQREFAAGHKGAWKGGKGGNFYIKEAGKIAENVRDVGLWGISPAYNMIVETRNAVLDDPNSTNVEKFNALSEAADQINALAGRSGLDARTIVTLTNEANANAGFQTGGNVSTFGQDYLGIGVPVGRQDSAVTTDDTNDPKGNARISALAAQLRGEIETVNEQPFDPATGSGYMTTFGSRDPATGVFKFDPKGTETGVVNGADIARQTNDAVAIVVPQAGASPLIVWVTGHEVSAQARFESGDLIPMGRVGADGNIVEPNPVVGSVYTYNSGGQTIRLYRTNDGIFTTRAPWDGNAREIDNPDGSITLDLTNLVFDGAPGTGRLPSDEDGTLGDFIYDPAIVAVDAIRQVDGYDPTEDFNTALIASIAASPDARSAARAFINDPLMQAYLQQQQIGAAAAGGGTEEEFVARLAGVQGQDSNLLARTAGITQSSSAANYSTVVTPRTNRFGEPEVKPEPTAPVLPGVSLRERQFQVTRPLIQLGSQITVPQAPAFRPSPSGVVAGPGAPPAYRAPSSLIQPAATQPRTPSTAVAPAPTSTAVAPVIRPSVTPTSTTTPVQAGPVVARPLISPVYLTHEQQIDPRTGRPYGGGR